MVFDDKSQIEIGRYGFMFEMVYLTYPKADIYSLAVLTRARINSLGSPLEVCIPGGNIIFQNPSATLQHVFITKFKKLWLLTPKLSNRGCWRPTLEVRDSFES